MTTLGENEKTRIRNLLLQSPAICNRHFAIVITPDNQGWLLYEMSVTPDSFRVPAPHRANDRAMCAPRSQRQMARLYSSFIQHPRVAIVNAFHAQTQQSART